MPKKFKKLVVLIIGLLFILFVLYLLNSFEIIKRYSNETFNKQLIGNLFISGFKVIPNYIGGYLNEKTQKLYIDVDEKTLIDFDKIIDFLYSPTVQYWRILHYLGKDQSFNYITMPEVKYHNAEVQLNNEKFKAKIKLSGGQIDHFDTKKRSLRVKLQNGLLLDMSKFNLYNPKVREGGIYEWIGHLLMKEAGLIYLKTGYLNVNINESNNGIYFFQEAPSIQMLINNNRNEGLLFAMKKKNNKWKMTNIYDENNYTDSMVFISQNKYINKLIEELNNSRIKFSYFFSIKKMARFYAVLDLINGLHSAYFENCYFYFNPVDSLIEPIGKEFSINFIESVYPLKTSKMENLITSYSLYDSTSLVDSSFIKDTIFAKEYKDYLNQIANTEYLNKFFKDHEEEIIERQYCLSYSNPYFPKLSKQHFFENQIVINKYLKRN